MNYCGLEFSQQLRQNKENVFNLKMRSFYHETDIQSCLDVPCRSSGRSLIIERELTYSIIKGRKNRKKEVLEICKLNYAKANIQKISLKIYADMHIHSILVSIFFNDLK